MNVECQIFPFLCFLSVNLPLIVLRTNWSLSDNSKVKMNDHKQKSFKLFFTSNDDKCCSGQFASS